jgi:hypothetical protein
MYLRYACSEATLSTFTNSLDVRAKDVTVSIIYLRKCSLPFQLVSSFGNSFGIRQLRHTFRGFLFVGFL